MVDESDNRYEVFAEDDETTAAADFEERPLTTLERLSEQFGDNILGTSTRLGEATALVDGKALTEVARWLRDEANFALLSDITAHDCHGKAPRFFVIYQLTNLEMPERLRLKVGVPEKEPAVDSVVSIWSGANFLEREVYDLFGIEFNNHPNLERIMMPEEWDGHPLRKDYPLVYEEVQFTHNSEEIASRKPFARE